MVLIIDKHLGDTIIVGNQYITITSILESRDLVLYSIHIGLHNGDAKYRIQSIKTETVTNITIPKITERIESYTILEVIDDEGLIHLLVNLKYKVIAADPGSYIRNTPHSTSCVFCKTKVRNSQHNTEATHIALLLRI